MRCAKGTERPEKLVPDSDDGTARIRCMNSNDASSDYPLQLLRHPATPAPVVSTIEARALFRSDGFLELAFRLRGDMARLLIPTLPTEDRKLLWEHTCFEAFVASVSDTAYREFNFSPSGQWASYAFSDYRLADETAAMIDSPQITSRLFSGRMELEAVIFPDALLAGSRKLLLGLSAVVEAADTVDGSHSYWALRHPSPRPDFHHRNSFAFELVKPR